jgi:hypothetical protein
MRKMFKKKLAMLEEEKSREAEKASKSKKKK